MAARELLVLGASSQVPTRDRDHDGYLLRRDGEGLLFDPDVGTYGYRRVDRRARAGGGAG
ncbi:hypothetical protein ACI79P_11690 [Blastococcus sp. SYSU DS0510]